jgi:spore germination cell wall hydrolase CwlJ-like protein
MTLQLSRYQSLRLILVVAASLGIAAIAGMVWWLTPQKRATTAQGRGDAEIALSIADFTSPPRSEVDAQEAAAAVALNAATPINPEAIVFASPFLATAVSTPDTFRRAQYCLALAVHYEAASESVTGQRAVAQVVLNRVRHPQYPRSVCGVVFQGSWRPTGCQFTFTCDGALARPPRPAAWQRALGIAADALAGYVEPSVGTATHYHADWVAPVWRLQLVKIAQIGTHIFYRWPGRMGGRAGFAMAYAGVEDTIPVELASLGNTSPDEPVVPVVATMPDPLASASAPALPKSQSAPLAADSEIAPLKADEDRGALVVRDAGRLD